VTSFLGKSFVRRDARRGTGEGRATPALSCVPNLRYHRVLHTQHAAESTAGETSASQKDAGARRPLAFLFLALALGALWFVCCRHLSEEWRFNEQYSYGWFVPFFAAYLFWLR